MNHQQIYLPISILLIAGFLGKTWHDASSSNQNTENLVEPYVIEERVIEENPSTQSARPIESVYAQPAAPANRIAKKLSDLSSQPSTSSPTSTMSSMETESSVSPVADPVNSPSAEDESLKEMINELDTAFHAQATDEHWSLNSSNQIYAYFDQMTQQESNFGSELRSVECRASLCKVEVLHESAVAADEFFLRFPGSVGSALPSISYQFENMPDGKINVLMFLASATDTAH